MSTPAPPSAVFDSLSTIPEFAPLEAARVAGDWETLARHLGSMPPARVTIALERLADTEDVDALLDAALAAHPDSPLALTARAVRHTSAGWEARGGGESDTVTRSGYEIFFDELRRAETLLVQACAIDPLFAPAWSARLLTARGLQLGFSEITRRHRRHMALSPHDLPAQAQYLQRLLPKWSGTQAEADAFVQEVVAAAPAGSSSGALIALLHIERWAELSATDAGVEHMQQRAVAEELRAAAARSVLDPAHELDAVGAIAHNFFLMAYWIGGHHEDAAVHDRALGGRRTLFPWNYLGDPTEGLADLKAALASIEEQGR